MYLGRDKMSVVNYFEHEAAAQVTYYFELDYRIVDFGNEVYEGMWNIGENLPKG